MFTGIVEEKGKIIGMDRTASGISLKIKTDNVYSDAKLGDSIAVNGVCLSVTDIKQNSLSFDVIEESLRRTTLSGLKINDPVNLERSLRADSKIGGHFVSGHIDYKARIEQILKGPEGTGFKVSLPGEVSNLVAEKGSIALDGVSLTVAKVEKGNFTVYLIPHTLKVTTFCNKKKGDLLNIEIDILSKYLARQIQKPGLQNLLKKYQYI